VQQASTVNTTCVQVSGGRCDLHSLMCVGGHPQNGHKYSHTGSNTINN